MKITNEWLQKVNDCGQAREWVNKQGTRDCPTLLKLLIVEKKFKWFDIAINKLLSKKNRNKYYAAIGYETVESEVSGGEYSIDLNELSSPLEKAAWSVERYAMTKKKWRASKYGEKYCAVLLKLTNYGIHLLENKEQINEPT